MDPKSVPGQAVISREEERREPSMSEQFEDDGAFAALPEQLVGRADWLVKRGRIKDSELMYAAAAEIRESRRARCALLAKAEALS